MHLKNACAIGLAVGLTILSACGGSGSKSQPSARQVFLAGQLTELKTLPCPNGVAADDWQELKSALADVIEQQLAASARQPSVAPSHFGSMTKLFYNRDTGVFS